MDRQKKRILLVLLAAAVLLAGGFMTSRIIQSVRLHRQMEAAERARQVLREDREAIEKAKEEERKRQIAALEAEAGEIRDHLAEVNTDRQLCRDTKTAAKKAREVKKEIRAFRKAHAQEDEELTAGAFEILDQAEDDITAIRRARAVDLELAKLYDPDLKTVEISTMRNERRFRNVQKKIWKIPRETYPKKMKQYDRIISRISKAWNYVNDDWNYETGTLRVHVEQKSTSYTNYWLCHIQTFSTDQLRSALCGGTYGNPRVETSREVAAHNGVIGINGSGFSYGSGIPAEGKTMIKAGKVYNDVYSNGNIMCVTKDGGMFTAIAGMTTEEMLRREVWDTYCFGPTLVEDGKAYKITSQFHETYRYQRMAVGMVNPGDYYILAVDGKGSGGSEGMDYKDMQKLFLKLNCRYAYNLDGGGSVTLVFKGRILNHLTDAGGERPCGDILYFIDVGDGAEGDEIVIHEDEAMLRPPEEKK